MARNIGLKVSYAPVWERVKAATGWDKDKQLADFLEVQPGTISGARQRDSFPIQWAFKIAQEYNCDTDWLMIGEGPMRTKSAADKSQPVIQATKSEEHLSHITIPRWEEPDPDYFDFIPMAEAHLSAGGGAFVLSEETKDFYAFRKNWLRRVMSSPKNAVLMGVMGDSMSPSIQDGDTVLIDTGRRHVYDGNIYALRLDETIVIKRLSLLPSSKILIISDNKAEYPPYEAEAQTVHVIGKVVWFSRALVKE